MIKILTAKLLPSLDQVIKKEFHNHSFIFSFDWAAGEENLIY